MDVRARLEEEERQRLHPRAALSAQTRGRERPMPEDDLRPAYQRDRDRILHSKAFRRLKGKTQVFLAPVGDHYRTRLTHTLEVAQVARTMAAALRLNESLVEAIALGHDLGHTPFGHAGERVLDRICQGGFHHAPQSVRVVEVLERDGQGLNLTLETRDGILKHSKGRGRVLMSGAGQKALTLEAEVVRIADIVAYVCHDLDDALRARLLSAAEIPEAIGRVLGTDHGSRLHTLVADVIAQSDLDRVAHISMSDGVHEALLGLREFLYRRVYENPAVHEEFVKSEKVLTELHGRFVAMGQSFRELWPQAREGETQERRVIDFISGMTDQYALEVYQSLFLPRVWSVH
jgi:dGTPase